MFYKIQLKWHRRRRQQFACVRMRWLWEYVGWWFCGRNGSKTNGIRLSLCVTKSIWWNSFRCKLQFASVWMRPIQAIRFWAAPTLMEPKNKFCGLNENMLNCVRVLLAINRIEHTFFTLFFRSNSSKYRAFQMQKLARDSSLRLCPPNMRRA